MPDPTTPYDALRDAGTLAQVVCLALGQTPEGTVTQDELLAAVLPVQTYAPVWDAGTPSVPVANVRFASGQVTFAYPGNGVGVYTIYGLVAVWQGPTPFVVWYGPTPGAYALSGPGQQLTMPLQILCALAGDGGVFHECAEETP